MQPPPERVLQWLYSSLRAQYENVDRTYTDVVKCLSEHPSIAPRTDIHTFDNGRSALLLVLQGTLAVPFRGNTYHFLVALWVPQSYPRESPMVYVIPTDTMAIRPGQHVSVEGRIYHPYLAHWKDHWNMSNLVDFLSILRDVFAKEPPVVSRHQQQQQLQQASPAAQRSVGSPPPIPQLPDELRPARQQSLPSPSRQSIPPPPPPKPPEASSSTTGGTNPQSSSPRPHPSGAPALPPKPYQANGDARASVISPIHRQSLPLPHSASGLTSPTSPPQLRSGISSPQPPYPGPSMTASPAHYSQGRQGPPPPPLPQPVSRPPVQQMQQPPPSQHSHATHSAQPAQPNMPPSYLPPAQPHIQQQQPPPPQPSRPKPVEDLLSGPIEALQSKAPEPQIAPPIPPNPEKDYLLTELTKQLTTKLHQSLSQNAAATSSLQAQNAAMRQAYGTLQAELQELHALDSLLASNEKILLQTMREGDRVMEGMKGKEIPNVDDVLVAPTVVGEQLYGLVADERAIGEAMFALTRALDAGRVEGDVFVKQTRTLAREQFLKKALIKKIGKGMGLVTDE